MPHGAFIIGSPELELIPLQLIGYFSHAENLPFNGQVG